MVRFSIVLALATILCAAAPASAATGHVQLVSLFADWRAFNHPKIVQGKPD